MTREEGKEFANALKNNYTIDFDKLPEFCDLVISTLEKNESAEEWYKLFCEKWDEGDLVYNFPKGMTNGEVIQALFNFDNANESSYFSKVRNMEGHFIKTDREFWNTPYQKGGE